MTDPIERQADAAARDIAAAAAAHGPHAAYEQAREEIAHALHRHPHDLTAQRTFGQRAADAVARAMGSWKFIIIQSVVVVLWIGYNAFVALRWLTTGAFDEYPYILLNLGFSTQAAYAAPVILMSSNRAAEVDRAHAENAYAQTDEIDQLQKEQMQILTTLQRILQAEDRISERLDTIDDKQ